MVGLTTKHLDWLLGGGSSHPTIDGECVEIHAPLFLERAMTAQRKVEIFPGDIIRFNYTNYKLETEWRRAKVKNFWFGSSTYHTGEQWFCHAFCLDRNDYRNFALRDMREVSVATSAIDQFKDQLRNKPDATD